MKTIHLPSIDSTNSYLKNNYHDLENYTFVSSDYQTDGRGRSDRQWKSENGDNLLFSLLILDKEIIKYYKEISIITAYSIVEVLKEYNIEAMIKWPNDVYVGDKKICGILLEAVSKEEIECMIIGVGLNVNQKEFDGNYLTTPTSIINETNKETPLSQIKEKVYAYLISNIEKIKAGYNFYKEITNLDYLKGKSAYALIEDRKEKIDIIRIENDYSLLIETKSGKRKMESGEITFHLE